MFGRPDKEKLFNKAITLGDSVVIIETIHRDIFVDACGRIKAKGFTCKGTNVVNKRDVFTYYALYEKE